MPLYPILCSFCGNDINSGKDHAEHIANHQEYLCDSQGRLTLLVRQYFVDGSDNEPGDRSAGHSTVQLPATLRGDSTSRALARRRRYCDICKRKVPSQYNMRRHTDQRTVPSSETELHDVDKLFRSRLAAGMYPLRQETG